MDVSLRMLIDRFTMESTQKRGKRYGGGGWTINVGAIGTATG